MKLNWIMNNIDYNIDIENYKIVVLNIKLLKGRNDKGIIWKYKGKRNNIFIISYIYLKCSLNNLLPDISNENVDKTSFGFTILSKDIWQVYVSSELNFVDSECQQDNFNRNLKKKINDINFWTLKMKYKSLILNSSSNTISSETIKL